MRGVEGERNRGAIGGIELVLVERCEAVRGEDRPIRHAVFLQVILGVADKPAGEVHSGGCGIVELDGVFERGAGVGEDLVDDDIREGQKVALAGRDGGGEADEVGRAVREMALGDAGPLRAKRDGGD